MAQDLPIIARHRKRGTGYVAVEPGEEPSLLTVTTIAGATYIVKTDSVEYIQPNSELKALAQKLGGGWRFEEGVMPVVVLTIDEARDLASRLEKLEKG